MTTKHTSDSTLTSRPGSLLTIRSPSPSGQGTEWKTTYARYLAAKLAQRCIDDYGNRIPILLSLGDFTTAPDLEGLITAQLMNHYGVRNVSTAGSPAPHASGPRILDGFDEMKFAMAPHEFNHISAQMRKTAAINPRILLLGRPDSIETDEEKATADQLQALNLGSGGVVNR